MVSGMLEVASDVRFGRRTENRCYANELDVDNVFCARQEPYGTLDDRLLLDRAPNFGIASLGGQIDVTQPAAAIILFRY